MAVLKQTSPTACPVAPSPKPSRTVPSANTKSAVGLGSAQDSPEVPAGAALVWVMASYLRIIEREARGRRVLPPKRYYGRMVLSENRPIPDQVEDKLFGA